MAKVVEEKLGRHMQRMKDAVSFEVKAACANSAPGKIILRQNSRFYIEEEGRGKDADGNKIKADPEKVKGLRAPLPRRPTPTVAMPLAQAVHL